MRIISHTPAYNLKVVLKETGFTADVLRAWERRYGLPKPQRTAGGHRLYSEHDIETIKWLKARQNEGLSISRAVELWREISKSGLDPIAEQPAAPGIAGPDPSTAANSQLEILRRSWLDASLSFDGSRAEEVLNQAFAIYPVETVCLHILQAGMKQIGDGWYRNQVTVQQEHFTSALAVRRLETLITASPNPTRRQTILVGCPPGEWHTFPVLLLCLLLRRRGLNVVYLGADIPIERLEETASDIRPDLVVLAAQQLTTAATLRRAALALQEKGYLQAFGGLIFNRVPQLQVKIPAYFLGESLENGVEMIERLLLASAQFSIPNGAQSPYQSLAGSFRDRRPLIKMELLTRLQQDDFQIENIEAVIGFLGDRLVAALELGTPAFLEADLDWVKHLLVSRQIPAESLVPLLTAYRDVIWKEMGETGAPITDCIGAYLAQNGEIHL